MTADDNSVTGAPAHDERAPRTTRLIAAAPTPVPASVPAPTSASTMPPRANSAVALPALDEESQKQREKRVAELWQRLDPQGAQELDLKGLKKGLRRMNHPMQDSDELLREIIGIVDVNGDGKIQYEEFQVFVETAERQLLRVFRSIDRDHDGRFNKDELRAAFRKGGLAVPPGRINGFFDDIDANHDGVITFDEWRNFLLFIPTRGSDSVLEMAFSYYASNVLVNLNAEGDSMLGDETLEGAGTTGFLVQALFGSILKLAQPNQALARVRKEEASVRPPSAAPTIELTEDEKRRLHKVLLHQQQKQEQQQQQHEQQLQQQKQQQSRKRKRVAPTQSADASEPIAPVPATPTTPVTPAISATPATPVTTVTPATASSPAPPTSSPTPSPPPSLLQSTDAKTKGAVAATPTAAVAAVAVDGTESTGATRIVEPVGSVDFGHEYEEFEDLADIDELDDELYGYYDDEDEDDHGLVLDEAAAAAKRRRAQAKKAKSRLMQYVPHPGYFLAGALAGGISRTATAPLDRLKVCLLVNTRNSAASAAAAASKAPPPPLPTTASGRLLAALRNTGRPIREAVVTLYKAGGVRTFFAGNGLNVIKIMPETAIKFGSYEAAKRSLAVLEGHGDATHINPYSKFVAGGVAGMVAQFCVYPVDTLKYRLQCETVPCGPTGHTLLVQTARRMYATGGVRAAYRGVTMGLIGMFPYSAIDMGTFELLKSTFVRYKVRYYGLDEARPDDGYGDDEEGMAARAAAAAAAAAPGNVVTGMIGATSGAFGATVVYPLNVLRTRLQTQGTAMHPATYTGIWDVATRTLAGEGVRGLYKGLTPNLLKVAPALSITWMVYENSKRALGLP